MLTSLGSSPQIMEDKRKFGERTKKLEVRIQEDEWDTESWNSLITEAQNWPIEVVRDVFERFLQQFPSSGKTWKTYAEKEMAEKNFDRAEDIFGRCLTKCLNAELYKCYVNFIQTTKANTPNAREQIGTAFEFALKQMHLDISCTPIWTDYINFLKEVKVLIVRIFSAILQ